MAHLIADDGDLPKEFIEFLQNFARFKFIMEVRVLITWYIKSVTTRFEKKAHLKIR